MMISYAAHTIILLACLGVAFGWLARLFKALASHATPDAQAQPVQNLRTPRGRVKLAHRAGDDPKTPDGRVILCQQSEADLRDMLRESKGVMRQRILDKLTEMEEEQYRGIDDIVPEDNLF